MRHLTNLKAIVSGFKNYTFPSPEMEAIAIGRADICSKCEHCDPNHPFKLLLGDGETIQQIKGMGCKLCGCLLSAKTRQLFSDCPAHKWGEKKLSISN